MKNPAPMLALLLLALAMACPTSAGQLSVTDSAGRSVTVPTGVRRIVCLGPGALRLIVYLRAANLVVGVEDIEKRRLGGRPYSLAHPEFAKLPAIGPGGPAAANRKPDMEAVLRVQPQVVFVTYMDATLADEVQRSLGCPVVELTYGKSATLDDAALNSILIAGKMLDRDARARAILDFIDSVKKDLLRRTRTIPQERKPGAYVGGIGHAGAFGIESTEQNFIPFLWINAANVAERVKSRIGSHVFIDKEKLLALNPEVIFLDGGGLALVVDDYRKKPDFYKELRAFKTRRMYTLLPFNSYSTNMETALADAYAAGKILYPDRFTDIDPQTKADDIYRFFVNKPVYELLKTAYGPIGGRAPFWTEGH